MSLEAAAAILRDMPDAEYNEETAYFSTQTLNIQPYSFRVSLPKSDRPGEFHYVKSKGEIHAIKPQDVWSYSASYVEAGLVESEATNVEPRKRFFVILEYSNDMPHVEAAEIETGTVTGIRTSASASTLMERVKSMLSFRNRKTCAESSLSTPLLTAEATSLNKSYTDLPGSSKATLVRSGSEAGTSSTPMMHRVPIEHTFDAFLTDEEVRQAYEFFNRFMLYSQARANRRIKRQRNKAKSRAARKSKSSGNLLDRSSESSVWLAETQETLAPPESTPKIQEKPRPRTKAKPKAKAKTKKKKKSKEDACPPPFDNDSLDLGAVVDAMDGAESLDAAIIGAPRPKLKHSGRSSSFTS